MFTYPVSECEKQVVIELEGDVRGMLTSNRDGLRYPYRCDLGKVIEAVTIDPKSFDRKKLEREIFTGRDACFYTQAGKVVRKFFEAHLPAERVAALVQAVEDSLSRREPIAALLDQAAAEVAFAHGYEVNPEGLAEVKVLDQHFSTDFVVSIEGTDLRKAPRAMVPATMRPGYRRIAQLWKWSIDHVLSAGDVTLPYRVGFTLDPEKIAFFSQAATQGGADVLINPKHPAVIDRLKSKRESMMFMLVTACHEISHRNCSYHSEEFVQEQDRLLCKALTKLPSIAEALRAAKKVVL
jgi:hypothetical protein